MEQTAQEVMSGCRRSRKRASGAAQQKEKSGIRIRELVICRPPLFTETEVAI